MNWIEHNFCEATHRGKFTFPGQARWLPRQFRRLWNGAHQIRVHIVGAKSHMRDSLHACCAEEENSLIIGGLHNRLSSPEPSCLSLLQRGLVLGENEGDILLPLQVSSPSARARGTCMDSGGVPEDVQKLLVTRRLRGSGHRGDHSYGFGGDILPQWSR